MKAFITTKQWLQVCCLNLFLMLNSSCLSPDKSKSETEPSDPVAVSPPAYTPTQSSSTRKQSLDSDDDEDKESGVISDGSYNATVDYSNPNTGHSATYTLSVEVSDGQVIQINFPNDGYLDEDHITPTDIDENGNASVEGEEGKTYDVHIDL